MAACPHYSPAGCKGTDDGPLLRKIATLRAENGALRAQIASIRDETLEEAAVIADMHDHRGDTGAAIRALRAKEETR